jgi:hypothetical protein
MSDQLLQWFPTLDATLRTVHDFWDGKGRHLVSLAPNGPNYRQLADEAEILRLSPQYLQNQARLPGTNIPSFMADFGTISNPRFWGGKVVQPPGGNVFIEPAAATLDDALALTPLPVDHPSMDPARALRLFRALSGQLTTTRLWLRTPDMQGPLNTAALVVNQEEFLMSLHTDGPKVHALLDRITTHLIALARHMDRASGQRLCGNIWPWTFLPLSMGLSFTEDMMPLLSAEVYKEFGLPQLQRLEKEFGALHIHCCGQWGHHARTLAQAGLKIRAMEFHYPWTRIEDLAPLAGGTVFVPYITLDRQSEFPSVVAYYRHLLEHTSDDHRYWFIFADESHLAQAAALLPASAS